MKSQSVLSSELEAFEKHLAKKLREYSMILETISQDENSLKDEFQQKLRQQEQRVSESSNRIEKSMANFSRDFSETTSEMGVTLDFLGEYQKLKTQIEQDDLPRHEQRFKKLMNDKVIEAIVLFKSALDKQEDDFKDAIDELNKSLQTINYTGSTYIKLCCDKTYNIEIRGFKEDLKICLGDVARQTAEDNEDRFQNIQTRLIERFKAEERWTSLVTDVRNWLEFSVSERYISDNAEKEHHTDSSGKSGGQKVKLAYTILASAIAYQFGLNQSTGKSRSFRFVVIDEAFSKSDDSNARYAMELFKNLDLQLLVVTPKDKINVIESYISTIHFVDNKSEGNYSRILPITIEEYQDKRQLALNSQHD